MYGILLKKEDGVQVRDNIMLIEIFLLNFIKVYSAIVDEYIHILIIRGK